MDHVEEFELQGHAVDELLLQAFALPQDAFTARAADGGPSIRDLLVAWLEGQRRTAQASILGREYHPLPATSSVSVAEFARAFGGFRLAFMETIESAVDDGLERRVDWTAPDGTTQRVALDAALTQLAEHGGRLLDQVEARLDEVAPR